MILSVQAFLALPPSANGSYLADHANPPPPQPVNSSSSSHSISMPGSEFGASPFTDSLFFFLQSPHPSPRLRLRHDKIAKLLACEWACPCDCSASRSGLISPASLSLSLSSSIIFRNPPTVVDSTLRSAPSIRRRLTVTCSWKFLHLYVEIGSDDTSNYFSLRRRRDRQQSRQPARGIELLVGLGGQPRS